MLSGRPSPISISCRHRLADGNLQDLPISLYNNVHPSWTMHFLKQCWVALTHSWSINSTNIDCVPSPCQEAVCSDMQDSTDNTNCVHGAHTLTTLVALEFWKKKSKSLSTALSFLGILRVGEGKQVASDRGYMVQSGLNLSEPVPGCSSKSPITLSSLIKRLCDCILDWSSSHSLLGTPKYPYSRVINIHGYSKRVRN